MIKQLFIYWNQGFENMNANNDIPKMFRKNIE